MGSLQFLAGLSVFCPCSHRDAASSPGISTTSPISFFFAALTDVRPADPTCPSGIDSSLGDQIPVRLRSSATHDKTTDSATPTLTTQELRMKNINPADMLSATISIRLTDAECRAFAVRARAEHRTLSQLVRLLLRDLLAGSETGTTV